MHTLAIAHLSLGSSILDFPPETTKQDKIEIEKMAAEAVIEYEKYKETLTIKDFGSTGLHSVTGTSGDSGTVGSAVNNPIYIPSHSKRKSYRRR